MRSAAFVLALLVILSGTLPVAAAAPLDTPVSPHSAASMEHPRPVADGVFEQTTTTEASLSKFPTELRISLRRNGDARWHVVLRYLVPENESAAFEQFGREFAAGGGGSEFDAALFRTAASRASTASGREMRITNVSRTWDLENSTGTLTLSFTWTNFAEERDDGSLRLGDAFEMPNGGTWFSSLDASQRLVIETPSGYVVNSTSFPLLQQEGAVIIEGPRSFDDEERLVVTYRRSTEFGDVPWTLLVGAGVAIAILALAAVAFRRRPSLHLTNGGVDEAGDDSAADAATDADGEADGEAAAGSGADAVAGVDAGAEAPDSGDESAATDAAVGPDTTEGEADDDVDVELLSDEERVEYLLRRSGGRMKQANIVKETGWSDAKVSQLLSAMADEGRVNKLRLGRENLISLAEEDGEEDDAA